MEQWKVDRINALAKKAKTEGLAEEERLEQEGLRKEYLAAIKRNLVDQLEHTYVVDEKGNKHKLNKKEKTPGVLQ